MKYNLTQIQSYIDRGLLEVQSHPTLPLKIYNYSRNTIFDRVWDEITLNMRGTILDNEGNLIAKGFDKFFNLEEIIDQPLQIEGEKIRHNLQEKGIVKIPYGQKMYVHDKLDGSLGILFYFQNEWILASKGSFTSEQAIKGKEILYKYYYNIQNLNKDYYYIFEIIYPENRIVVNYGDKEELILLSIVDKRCFIELTPEKCFDESVKIGCNFSSTMSFGKVENEEDLRYLAKKIRLENDENKEGYIFRFWPSNFRCKVKFAEYCRLHSLVTQCSNLDIWRALKEGKNIDLDNVPDEFDDFVRKTIHQLKFEYNKFMIEPFHWFDTLLKQNFENKKDKAIWINENVPRRYRPFVFSLLNGGDYREKAWNEIRPVFEKPFWNKNIEE